MAFEQKAAWVKAASPTLPEKRRPGGGTAWEGPGGWCGLWRVACGKELVVFEKSSERMAPKAQVDQRQAGFNPEGKEGAVDQSGGRSQVESCTSVRWESRA